MGKATVNRAEARLELALLGLPGLSLSGQPVALPVKKFMGVIAYLALEGPTPRGKLVSLLWSNLDEESARRNLRLGLHRLKTKTPELARHLETSGEVLSLSGAWQSDVRRFEAALEAGQHEAALEAYRGHLLEGFEIKDAEGFYDWLGARREHLNRQWQKAMLYRAEVLETRGEWRKALDIHQRLLADDNLQERHHREVMRLFYLLGDREVALEQFEQLQATLRKELGMEPRSETLSLLDTIRQGGSAHAKRALLLTSPEAVPEVPAHLYGREGLLGDGLRKLERGEWVLLHGFGGMGKTALAATLARDFLRQTGKPVLWLRASTQGPEAIFEALAYPYDAQQGLLKAEHKASFVHNLLKEQQPGLLVLDDVWNGYSLQKLLEALPAGLPLLVTARERYPQLARLYVDRLERPDALHLLSAHAEETWVDSSEPDALCELLGDHPFALRLAGLTLRQGGMAPSALKELIKDAPHDLKTPGEFRDEGSESVAALLGLSLETLSDPEYEAFLSFGILPTPRTTAGFLARCMRREPEATEEALYALSQRGLAERDSRPGSDTVSYRLHDLAHSYAKANRLQRPSSLARAALEYLEAHKTDYDLLEADISNLLAAAQAAKGERLVRYLYLLTVDGAYFTARGHSIHSVELLRTAAATAETVAPELAHHLLGKLGDYHQKFLGDLDGAADHYRRAMEVAREVGSTARQAAFLAAIGQIKGRQNKPEAEDYFARAYEIARNSGDDLTLCAVLEKHGYVVGIRGDHRKANALLKESLAALERLGNSSTLSPKEVQHRRFFTLLNLAESEDLTGSFEAGLSACQQALELAQSCANDLWAAYAHSQAADTYHRAGQRPQVLDHMKKALELFERNHAQKDVTRVMNFLASEGYSLESRETLEKHPSN